MTSASMIDMATLTERLPELARQYQAASPFPHIVLDDVLFPEAFKAAAEAFPEVGNEFWTGYLHVNETKYGNTHPDTWGPVLNGLAKEFVSKEFTTFLTELTGIENLLPDWSMDGGGLHQTLRGGHLNVHADFTTHHVHRNWARRINILLYLNESWADGWGGELELWDTAMTAAQAKVKPVGNRMLVFSTTHDSYHGHPDPLTCPEGVARKSMALYYFTEEEAPERRATNYRARPDDGAKALAIALDRTVLDLYDRVKVRLGFSDEAVSNLLKRVHRVRARR
jgi:hypothetical protein